MLESEMWDDGVGAISEGDVVTFDGRPVHFRTLVKRRWGWPKKAAYMAADHLISEAKVEGWDPAIYVDGTKLKAQQDALFRDIPGLRDALMTGLARGAQREILDACSEVRTLTITMREDITDDGLVLGVLAAVADRLGTSAAALRKHTVFNTGCADVELEVDPRPFDP